MWETRGRSCLVVHFHISDITLISIKIKINSFIFSQNLNVVETEILTIFDIFCHKNCIAVILKPFIRVMSFLSDPEISAGVFSSTTGV